MNSGQSKRVGNSKKSAPPHKKSAQNRMKFQPNYSVAKKIRMREPIGVPSFSLVKELSNGIIVLSSWSLNPPKNGIKMACLGYCGIPGDEACVIWYGCPTCGLTYYENGYTRMHDLYCLHDSKKKHGFAVVQVSIHDSRWEKIDYQINIEKIAKFEKKFTKLTKNVRGVKT